MVPIISKLGKMKNWERLHLFSILFLPIRWSVIGPSTTKSWPWLNTLAVELGTSPKAFEAAFDTSEDSDSKQDAIGKGRSRRVVWNGGEMKKEKKETDTTENEATNFLNCFQRLKLHPCLPTYVASNLLVQLVNLHVQNTAEIK
ncbi:hypothetical protein QOT17_023785 [Balamuthia mandrillaris]